jgi:anti-anti-sigma regulatory factor
MTITISAEQDLRTIGALQQQLLEQIMPGGRTVLDIGGITAADIGFVQVIEAARRHADAIGADVSLAGPVPAAVRDVLDLAGLDDAFWTGEATAQ